MLGTQLLFLVKNSNDPDVGRYILANLYQSPVSGDCPALTAASIRAEARYQLWGICTQNPTFLDRHKDPSPLQKALDKERKDLLDPSKRVVFSQDLARKQQEALAKLQTEAITQQVRKAMKQQEEMASIWRELMKIDNAIVIRKMNNPDPVISIVAIQVAAKKRLPVEKECIALLASANPKVRQAARQTLVRLGRSVDFGPEPTATPQQIAASVRSWSSWADIQTEEPEEPAEQTETP